MRKLTLTLFTIAIAANFAFAQSNLARDFDHGSFQSKTTELNTKDVTTLYFEGFENYDPTSATTARVLPTGWGVYRTTALNDLPTTVATTAPWVCNNPVSNPFAGTPPNPDAWQSYVRTGQGSMIIGYTAPNFTWAISSEISLPSTGYESLNLEFWMWYAKTGGAGTWPSNFHFKVYVDGAWVNLQSWIGQDNNLYATPIQFDFTSYAGKTIKLGFVYEYTDGYQMGIDDIKISGTPATVTQPNVTLTVTNLNPAWDNIWVKSAVDDWAGHQMVQDGDNWTFTYTEVADGTYAWGAYQANAEGGEIAWLAPSPNPEFTVAAPNVTGTTSFTIAAPGETFPVTFTVTNLNPDHTQIKIKGSFNSWATVPMDAQPDNVWTKTFQVEAGTYEWGVVNQDDGWLIEGPNPSFTVSSEGVVTGQVTYTIPGLGPLTFNFNVDMNAQIDAGNFIPGADVLELVGNFNGWPGTTVPEMWRLTDTDEDGIYSLTTGPRFNNKQTIQFKVRLNGNWDTNELPGMVPNRQYTFLDNITNVYHCVYGVRGTTSVTQAMPFVENFENAAYETNFPPVNWSMVDYDQDGNIWYWGTRTSGDVTNGAIRSQSWLSEPAPNGTPLTPENFLITPRIDLAGATNPVLSYRVAATSVNYFAEKYQVYVSKLGNDVSEFVPANMLIDEILTTENGGWNYKTMTFNLTSYIGEKIYVAFVHKGSTDKDRITIDDVMVQEQTSIITKPVVTMSLYPNPASNNLNIVSSSNIRNIRVMNLLGQQVLSIANVGSEFYTLDIAKLNAGVYIVSITDANGKVNSSRFIKK